MLLLPPRLDTCMTFSSPTPPFPPSLGPLLPNATPKNPHKVHFTVAEQVDKADFGKTTLKVCCSPHDAFTATVILASKYRVCCERVCPTM